MNEIFLIQRTPYPVTQNDLVKDLQKLGICEGDVVLVHTSLSSLGWVCGGPQTVIEALLKSVGETGTIVMPAHSGDWSDPAEWRNPPVPDEWLESIYQNMPAFNPAHTPVRGIGVLPELFRTYTGTLRSNHPQTSFSANGKFAKYITENHQLTPQLGMDSPLGKMYSIKSSKVLFLGTGYDSCSCFHLSETMLKNMAKSRHGTALIEEGERVWKWFDDYEYDSFDFCVAGKAFEESKPVTIGKVGIAECRLFDMIEAVDFAKDWLEQNRE